MMQTDGSNKKIISLIDFVEPHLFIVELIAGHHHGLYIIFNVFKKFVLNLSFTIIFFWNSF